MRKSVHTRAYKVLQEHLVAARHKAGITQEQLAKRLNRPQSFIAKYEGGERRVDLIELFEICAAVKTDARKVIQAVATAL